MFIFGLCSTSDDWPSNPSKNVDQTIKKNKNGLLSPQKIKCLFLDYVELLMIGQAVRTENIERNTKKMKKAP